MTRTAAFFIFCVVLAGLVAFIISEQPPRSYYKRTMAHGSDAMIPIPTGKPFSFTLEAPGPNISGVWLHHAMADSKHEVRVTIENLTRSAGLWEEVLVGQGSIHEATFSPNNAKGDQIRITYLVEKSRLDRWPNMAQAVTRAFQAPDYALTVEVDGQAQDIDALQLWPLVQLHYRQNIAWLAWLWPGLGLAMIGLFIANAGRSQRMIYLLLVGVASTAFSALLWAQRYEHNGRFDDPDSFAEYGEQLLAWTNADETGRAELKAWYHGYRNAHVWLVPGLMALGMKLTGCVPFAAYIFLVGISSFGTLLAIDWWGEKKLGLSPRTLLLLVSLLAAHLVFQKSFVKASTDVPGVALNTLGWIVVSLRFWRPFRWWEDLLFGGLLLALVFVRPPGLAYLVFFGGSAVLVDMIRTRRLVSLGMLKSIALFGLPPILITGALFLGFGWVHNFGLAKEYSKNFYPQAIFSQWYPTFITTAHILVFTVWGLRKRDLKLSTMFMPLAWTVGLLTLLALVKAPFILRLFLPVVPAIYAMVAPAIERYTQTRFLKWVALAGAVILMAANLLPLWWQLQLPGPPPKSVFLYMYF